MSIDTMTWADLSEFDGKRVAILGTDENAEALARHMGKRHPSIQIDRFLNIPPPANGMPQPYADSLPRA